MTVIIAASTVGRHGATRASAEATHAAAINPSDENSKTGIDFKSKAPKMASDKFNKKLGKKIANAERAAKTKLGFTPPRTNMRDLVKIASAIMLKAGTI